MTIKTQLTKNDFIKASFASYLSKLSTKITFGIILLFLILSIFLSIFSSADSVSQIFVFGLVLIIRPLLIYVSAKKNFESNKAISELIEYHFDEKKLIIQGESFNSTSSWDKIYKVTQLKDWVFIWQNNTVANIIAKRDIWGGQLVDLKEILDNHKVKNNL